MARETGAMTGTERIFWPLPITVTLSAPRDGRVLSQDAERFRDAQARAVEERQHGSVAGEDPGLAGIAVPAGGIGDAAARPSGASGLGRLCGSLGPRTADSAETVPWPSRSRKRPKARLAARARISERGLRPSARRDGDEGPDVPRGESRRWSRCRAARRDARAGSAGRSRDVALIGLDGLRAHAPFRGKIGEPAQPGLHQPRLCRHEEIVWPNHASCDPAEKRERILISRHAAVFPPRWKFG